MTKSFLSVGSYIVEPANRQARVLGAVKTRISEDARWLVDRTAVIARTDRLEPLEGQDTPAA